MAAENFKVKKGLEVGTGITANSDGVNVTGIITATQFKGDGSGLTGVVGSGSGVVVKDEGSAVGTAGTINFVGTGVAAAIAGGTATVTINSGTTTINNNGNNKLITGSGSANTLEAESGLTYDGTYFNHIGSGFKQLKIDTSTSNSASLLLKNQQGNFTVNTINNSGNRNFTVYDGTAGVTRFSINQNGTVGITSGLNVTGVVTATTLKGNGDFVDIDVDGQTEVDDLNVAGVSTFISVINANNGINLTDSDNKSILLGESDDMRIRHTGSHSEITDEGTGSLRLGGNNVVIGSATFGVTMASFAQGGAAKLYHNDQQKLTTTINGIEVPDLNVTGVGTVGRLETSGVTLGTNNNTFAAKFIDDAVANFGTDNDLKISHDDTHARITNTKGNIVVSGIISATSDVKVGSAITMDPTSGIITATSFSGSGAGLTNIPSAQLSGALPALDGSALTGITASGSGIIVKHDGNTVGTAGTINFSTNLDVSAISAGIVTVTASGSSGVSLSGSTNNTVATVTGANALIGEANLTFDGSTLTVDTTDNQKIILSGTNNPYIRFKENSTDKALIGWHSDGYFKITNNEDSSTLRIKDLLEFSTDSSTFYTVWHAGNDGVSSGLDADLLDGQEGSYYTNATNLGSGTIPNGRFPTTLPATSGANLTALNASEITSGTLPIARIADDAVTFAKMQNVGTGVFIGRNDSGTGDIETLTAAEARTLLNVADGATVGITTAAWTVGHSGASYYTFTGPGGLSNTQNADIHLVRGQTYQFIVNASGHGFGIQTVSGTWTGSNAYTTGITNPGAAVGTITFRVPYSAPGRLYYACTSQHSGMVGNIYISGGGGVVTYEGAKELQLGNNTSSSVNTANLVTLDLGGTHHDTAGSTGKLKLWKDAIDEMSLGVSSNQMDFILTSGSYSYNFYGGNTGATRLMQLNQTGNIELALGNENSSGVTAPLSINLGGTYSSSAGNGNDLSAKLKVWCNGSDVMGFSVSGNQLDYIVTSESYDHVFYGGNAGTTELARFTGDGNFGIGTNDPSTALEVKGDITVYNSNNQGDIFFGEYGDVADSKALIRMDQVSGTAGELQFHTESGGTLTKRLTIDSSGRVQIGSSTDAARNTFNGIGRLNLQNNSQDGTVDFTQGIVFTNNASNEGTWTHGGIVCTGSTGYDGNMVFGTDGTDARDMSASTITEKMRLTADGCLLVGKSTVPQNSGGPDNTSSGTAAEFVYGHVNVGVEIRSTNGASNQKYLGFKYGGGPTDNGGIRRDGTTNNVEFYGGSDRRIKKNIQDMDNTLSKICQISLKKFDFKDGTGSGVGVIGQELINVFPEKVTKTDDGTGDTVPDGVEPWSVGHNYTYQILKAIQELKAENDSLKARIATLEGS